MTMTPKQESRPPRPIARFVSRFHRWLALIVGIQVFLWILSGAVMALFDIDDVRGTSRSVPVSAQNLDAQSFVAPGGIIARTPFTKRLEIKTILGRTVYIAHALKGPVMYDALTGEKLTPIKEIDARLAANTDFPGKANVRHALLLTKTPGEYRGPLPVWQVTMNDSWKTRLYISPATGEIISRRNRLWRIFDFFWMLHIMDYEERDDFNNWLLRAFAITSLLFVVSGLIVLGLKVANGHLLHDLRRLKNRAQGQ